VEVTSALAASASRAARRGRREKVSLAALGSAFVAYRQGRKAETLDRDTALALLQESGGQGLRDPFWQLDLVVFDTDPSEAGRLAFLKDLEPS
jgi:hypothetical protein